jgi:hypothetical protein
MFLGKQYGSDYVISDGRYCSFDMGEDAKDV